MKWFLCGAVLSIATLTAGCSKPEPRSRQYFEAHIVEARQIVAGCREGSARGDECTNADYAVQVADARARAARFFKINH